MWRVLGERDSGSTIVEAALVLAGLPFVRDHAGPVRVVLPDGTEMTETAAIVLYIDGLVPEAELVPGERDPLRRELLRWLMFVVAAIQPTFAQGDDAQTEAHRASLWRLVEGAARGPWFLGETFSVLDLYTSVMTRWSPGRAWFAEACPRLFAIATALDADPRLIDVWADHDLAV
jgi:GST-like protein